MHATETLRLSRTAGALYVLVILTGLGAELGLRGPLIHAGDPEATFAAVTGNLGQFRAAILTDAVMVAADIGLALLFFGLLRHVSEGLARTAMMFRLIQAATIAASALFLVSALGASDGTTMLRLIETHAAGYDFGLIFFAVNTAITAWLLARSGLVPRWLPPLLQAAALVYLAGSVTRIVAPGLNELMQPAYLVPVIAETALAVTLLIGPRSRAKLA
ncbi:DUF4386 family protein [Rhodobacterales bacterium HKCCE3408]|nr:DUF4386 family protein [Rhodobacterales bacterium HKCCE3408]